MSATMTKAEKSITHYKPCPKPQIEAKQIDTNASGQIVGFASVFDLRDNDGDVIRHGSYAKSIEERVAAGTVPLMARHFRDGGDASEAIGIITLAKETEVGLWVEANLFPTQKAQEIRASIASAPQCFGMSVGWQNVPNGFRALPEGGREFTEMKLREVTITLMPAQEATIGTVGAKSENMIEDLCRRVAALEEAAKVDAKSDEPEDTGEVVEASAEEPAVDHDFDSEIARQKRLLAVLDQE